MNAILILGGLFLLYEFLMQQQQIARLTQGGSTAAPLPLPGYQSVSAQIAGNTAMIGSGVAVGLQGAQMGLSAAGSSLAGAVPIVGAAFSAIFGALMAASAKRAAQARNENSAVVQGVLGWDKGVAQVVAAYNAGQLTLAEVQQFLMAPQVTDNVPSGQGALWTMFWQEVGPQVQPGRNGCHSGADTQPPAVSFCTGNKAYGAGCCVAYDDLKNSSIALLKAAAQADANPGTAVSAQTFSVYASKYGGVNRPGYTVTFKKPAATQSLFGL